MRPVAANRCLIWGEQLAELGDGPGRLLFARYHPGFLSKYNIEHWIASYLTMRLLSVWHSQWIFFIETWFSADIAIGLLQLYNTSWMKRQLNEILLWIVELCTSTSSSTSIRVRRLSCRARPRQPEHCAVHRWPDRTYSVRRGPSVWTHHICFSPPGSPFLQQWATHSWITLFCSKSNTTWWTIRHSELLHLSDNATPSLNYLLKEHPPLVWPFPPFWPFYRPPY